MVFGEGTTSLPRKIAPIKTIPINPQNFKNSFKTKVKNGEGLFEIPPQKKNHLPTNLFFTFWVNFTPPPLSSSAPKASRGVTAIIL